MIIRDHINLMFRNPLIGSVQGGEERFPDMSEPYSVPLQHLARDVAAAQSLTLQDGVYAGLLGPTYETAAEVKMRCSPAELTRTLFQKTFCVFSKNGHKGQFSPGERP